MTAELDLVRLLYRADWTRLSLTADVRGMVDYQVLTRRDEAQNRFLRSVPPGLTEVRHFRAHLVVAPGGRYHAQADGNRDEFDVHHVRDGALPDGLIPFGPDDAEDRDPVVETRLTRRYMEMLRPVSLLGGFALASRGPAIFVGRDAHHVVATPSASAALITPGLMPLDRIEVFIDAETGILLRREEIFDGQTLRFTEFTSARFGALEGADAAHFAPGSASDTAASDTAASDAAARDLGRDAFQQFSGLGWKAAKTAVDAACAVLGTAIAITPGGSSASGSGRVSDPEAAIPADPFPVEWVAEAQPSRPISDKLLDALARGGRVPFTGVFHRWTDSSAMTADFRSAALRHGWTGVNSATRALSDREGTAHKESRVRYGANGKYRIDVLRETGKGHPASSACDGERRWRVYPNRVTVGPAGPDYDQARAALADASWLLRYELSGETELTYGGRPAFAVRVAAGEYAFLAPGGIMLSDARAIIDAEAGIVLLFVSVQGGRPSVRSELREVTVTSDEDDAAFRIVPPPGVRVVQVSGNLLDEIDIPDPVRAAMQTAGQASRAAERGFTAVKSFFDSLRERR